MERENFEQANWVMGLDFQRGLECELCGEIPAAYDSQGLGDAAGPFCVECLPHAIWDVLIHRAVAQAAAWEVARAAQIRIFREAIRGEIS